MVSKRTFTMEHFECVCYGVYDKELRTVANIVTTKGLKHFTYDVEQLIMENCLLLLDKIYYRDSIDKYRKEVCKQNPNMNLVFLMLENNIVELAIRTFDKNFMRGSSLKHIKGFIKNSRFRDIGNIRNIEMRLENIHIILAGYISAKVYNERCEELVLEMSVNAL